MNLHIHPFRLHIREAGYAYDIAARFVASTCPRPRSRPKSCVHKVPSQVLARLQLRFPIAYVPCAQVAREDFAEISASLSSAAVLIFEMLSGKLSLSGGHWYLLSAIADIKLLLRLAGTVP